MLAELTPLRSEADYEAALKQAETLGSSPAGTPEGDRLDILATLIDAYEAGHAPVDAPDPSAAIEFRMEQMGLTRTDLTHLIGSRSRVAEVLGRKRALSIGMIRRLHESLGIPADILIRPTVARAA